MKKYILSLVIVLMAQGLHAMKVTSLELSQSEDQKALRLAKLFHKYPKGYGDSDREKQITVFKMKSFAQSEHTLVYQRVKKYQKTLHKIEQQELCDLMYNYKDSCGRDFISDLRQQVFTKILYLRGDLLQYYAADSTSQFMAINQEQFQDQHLADEFKHYFLDEIKGNNTIQLSFSDEGDNDVLYPKDNSILNSTIIIADEDNVYSPRKITMPFARKTIRELVAFLKEKRARIEKFKVLSDGCLQDLSLHNQQKALECFFQLSEQLKGHDIKRVSIPNDKRVIRKGHSEPEYFLLPLEEVFSINKVAYDVPFYNQLANSNNEGVCRVEIDHDKLVIVQQFPQAQQDRLKDIQVKIQNKSRSFMDYLIIHGPLLANSLISEVVANYIGDIALVIGCSTTTAGGIGVIGGCIMSYSTGEYVFPGLDTTFNSHMPRIKACIKEAKVRSRDKRGVSFFMTNLLHGLLSFIGNKFLSFQSLPIKVFGGIVHIIRIPLHLATWHWVESGDARYHEYCVSDLKEKLAV